jgi:hypothetical protein
LGALAAEQGAASHEKSVRPLALESGERYIDLAAGAGVYDPDLQSHGAGSGLHVFQRGLRIGSIRGIDEHRHTRGSGHQLAQELQPLRGQLNREKIDPSQIASLGQA